ncbi:unnamed protein product, partial [Darwinula stevensoni]
VDILINNAGVSSLQTVFESTRDAIKRLFDVNFLGNIMLAKALLPHFRQRKAGHIVASSSVLAIFSTPKSSAYSASKRAVQGYYETLRVEEARNGTKITLLFPGLVKIKPSTRSISEDRAHIDRSYLNAFEMDVEVFADWVLIAIANEMSAPCIAKKWMLFTLIYHFPSIARWAYSSSTHKPYTLWRPLNVILMVEEYQSFPTNTLYVLRDIGKVLAPAITICPIHLSNNPFTRVEGSGHWSERTFFEVKGYSCHKCFMLIPKKSQLIQTDGCSDTPFRITFDESLYIEPESFFLKKGNVISLVIRPEVIQRQSIAENPCIVDENYSYARCMENCFWRMVESHPNVPCMLPSLLSKETNLTKSECQDPEEEMNLFMHLGDFYKSRDRMAPYQRECNCPARCNTIDYHIFGDPTPGCDVFVSDKNSWFYLNYPSKQVPHFLEKEKVTLLDLLSNIGGIVGICLGSSLLTLFDIIEKCFLSTYNEQTRCDKVQGIIENNKCSTLLSLQIHDESRTSSTE